MTLSLLRTRILPALLGACAMSAAHAAVQSIDLGAAAGYSGFFYNDVQQVADVEGRLAVGGTLATSGFSFGYRTPYGVGGPSVVVGGNVKLGDGAIYTGPASNVDTNATIGPITEYPKQLGYGVYGGANTSKSYLDLRQQANVIDFGAARTQLTTLSSTLAAQQANGTVESKWGGLYLTGDKHSDVQVFTIDASHLGNLFLQDVKAGASVIINVTGGGAVSFTGGQDGQLESLRDRVLFNLVNATEVDVNTFAWGTVLANNAILAGSGHLEGNIIAAGMNGKVEIGFEPFKGGIASPVPEPQTYAMLLGGLALVGALSRRRQRG